MEAVGEQEQGGGTPFLHRVHCHLTGGRDGVAPCLAIFASRLVLFVISVTI